MQNFLVTLLICSVTMSMLALLYMAITPLLARRYSATGRYYGWLIIIVGLIIPFRPQWGRALINIDAPMSELLPITETNGNVVNYAATPQINLPTMTLSFIDNAVVSDTTFSISWWRVGFTVWLIGVILFISYHSIKHYGFVKKVRRWSENITNREILSLLENLKSEMGITRQIPICKCMFASSPMMVGIIKPQILLPTTEVAEDELYFILKHELVHYKRKDLFYKYLVLAATVLHWFNPIVYLMAKAVNILCEISCDAEVLHRADMDTRQSYGEAIIGVVQYKSNLQTALSTTFYGGKNSMTKRILSIMDASKKRVGATVLCGVIVLTFGTGFAFAVNTNTSYADENFNTVTAHYIENNVTFTATETTDPRGRYFEIYREFGLIYDPTIDHLYFNGELVRYFQDIIPLYPFGSHFNNATIDTRHFTEGGTVDVRAVRDFSQVIQNADGSTNPAGILVRLERVSQEEFDARDFDDLRLSFQSISYMLHEDSGDAHFLTVNMNSALSSDNTPNIRLDTTVQINDDGSVAIVYYNATTGRPFVEWFAGIETFDVTFTGNILNGGIGNIYYQGQLVGTLIDDTAERATWLSSSERGGNINIRVIRSESGYITGISVLG